MFGLKTEKSSLFYMTVFYVIKGIKSISWKATLLSFTTLFILFFFDYVNKKKFKIKSCTVNIPGPITVVINFVF